MPRKKPNTLSHRVHEALDPLHHPLRLVGRLVRRAGKPPGLPPGTLVHTGARRVEETRIEVIRYGPDGLQEEVWDELPEVLPIPRRGGTPRDEPGTRPTAEGVLWINVDGLHDVDLLRRLGEAAGAHPLAMEDVASIGQRPKVEDYDDHLFIVAHMLQVQEAPFRIQDEQIALLVAPGLLISFQEQPGDVFGPVRERLRAGKGRIRSHGSDYLAYALIDALVDSYFHVMERMGERIETLEGEMVERPDHDAMQRLHHLKRELLLVRRSVWPLREMMAALLRVEAPLVHDTTKVYLRDIHDHSYQIIDTVELLRDVTLGVRDLYLSALSNRTNEVMKVLTVMASIFIPLTFIAGVYGMNFEYMPELAMPWAYPAVLGLMVGVALGLLGMFRWRGWI